MSSHDPRNHVGCSHWPGPSSPRAMRIHTPSLSMPSVENSISSGVGANYLLTLLFNVTCQPYHQASHFRLSNLLSIDPTAVVDGTQE